MHTSPISLHSRLDLCRCFHFPLPFPTVHVYRIKNNFRVCRRIQIGDKEKDTQNEDDSRRFGKINSERRENTRTRKKIGKGGWTTRTRKQCWTTGGDPSSLFRHTFYNIHLYSFGDLRMLSIGILSVCLVGLAGAQLDAFALPSAQRYAPKPTVPPEFSNYFELDGHARELVDSLLGPRPGGLFPEKTFEIGAPQVPVQPGQPAHVVSKLERTLESFFTAPETPPGQALPPGFGSGFSLLNNNKALTSFGDIRRSPSNGAKNDDTEVEGSGDGKSSIAGIPNVS